MKSKGGALVALVLCCIILSAAFTVSGEGPVQAVSASNHGGFHKVIAQTNQLDPNQPGVSLWHDYGSFAIYRVTEEGLSRISSRLGKGVYRADEMDLILIDAYPFNTQSGQVLLPESLSLQKPSGYGLQLVQFVGPIKTEWLKAIESTGSALVHYIANNAYLVWSDDGGRLQLNTLASKGEFLQYSAPYQPYFKLSSSLRERLEKSSNAGGVVRVFIQLYNHAGKNQSENVIQALSIEQMAPWDQVMAFETSQVTVRISDLLKIAYLPDVFWIGEWYERELFDEVQGQILAGNFDTNKIGPSGPGYLAWLTNLGFSTNPADYPVVDITDDGIGDGTVNTGDSTLHVTGRSSNPTRLAYLQNCTSANNGSGPDGHGHINASIAGGYDDRTGFPYQDVDGYNRGLGVNPFGRLAGTRIFDQDGYDLSNCGNSDTDLIKASYTAGARISSNSWGCAGCASSYDVSSQAYDAGTRDANPTQSGNQQLLFVFAAGNSGAAPGTISSPANAKNVVTVGASENDRPTWTDGCFIDQSGADNAMDMIPFSSRGPAPGNRVKPEVIAPGTHIQGTASTHPDYTGLGVCDQYFPFDQTIFAASSGTSHSTPAVAGVASLYSYWLKKNYNFTAPSPALIKAYLIAHPTYLTGVSAGDNLPSNNQGYGMPDMSLAFDNTSRYLVDQSVVFDESGETWTFNGAIADPGKPVRIVMAYTDQAGAVGTSPQVNDLNLLVEVNGSPYLGNIFDKQWSVTGGSPDTKNNYEAVFLPSGVSGTLKITVTAFNIAGNGIPNHGDGTDQDFALVCFNCINYPDFSLIANPASQDVCSNGNPDVTFNISVGQILGYNHPVTLAITGQPVNTNTAFDTNPVIPPGSSQMTLSNTGLAAPGSYSMDVIGVALTSTHTTTVGLNLYDNLPGQTELRSPANGAANQSVRPVFIWDEALQAGSYDIEIATDISFTKIIVSAKGLLTRSFTPTSDLEKGELFYWRVRADNACGQGDFSTVYTFTTVPQPGDCSVGFVAKNLYSEDFDSGASGWSHSGIGDTWTLSSTRAHSGLKAYHASDVASLSDQSLVSPAISLPAGLKPLTLMFWNYQSIERSFSVNSCWDAVILEISTDGGTTWRQIPSERLLTDPYDGLVPPDFGNPLAGSLAWCGDPQDWLNSIVNLDAYENNSVRFRFRLGSDSSIGREGWYIDDVQVQGCQPLGVAFSPTSQTQAGLPGETVVHTFLVTNTGEVNNSFNFGISGNVWETTGPANSGMLVPGTSASIPISVRIPDQPDLGINKSGAVVIASDTFTLTATSQLEHNVSVQGVGMTLANVNPKVQLSDNQSGSGYAGTSVQYIFTITNKGDYSDSYLISSLGDWPADLSLDKTGQIGPGKSQDFTLTVHIPANIPAGEDDVTTILASSELDQNVFADTQATTYSLLSRTYLPLVYQNR